MAHVRGKPGVQDAEVASRLINIAVHGVIEPGGREVLEVHGLARIRADAACHEHEP